MPRDHTPEVQAASARHAGQLVDPAADRLPRDGLVRGGRAHRQPRRRRTRGRGARRRRRGAACAAAEVVASVGFQHRHSSSSAEVAEGKHQPVWTCRAAARPARSRSRSSRHAVAARVRARGRLHFSAEEVYLARGMAHVLALSLRLFRLAAEERRQRHEAETQSELNQRLLDSLQERQELLERLARIQRSITHGASREDVLEAICEGARELLGDEVAGLQLIPPDDPIVLELVAMKGPRRRRAARRARPEDRGHRRAGDGRRPARRLRGLPGRRLRRPDVQGARHPRRDVGAGARVGASGRQPDGRLLPARPPLQLDRARHAAGLRRPREPRALGRAQHPGDARGGRRAHPGPLPLARATARRT